VIFTPGEQRTLAGTAAFEGIGLHTGERCSLRVHEGAAGAGIVFRSGRQQIPAVPSSVVDTSRGTTLGGGGERVVCVEHLMAALAICGIDNAVCEVEGPELPAMDGSALPFCQAFVRVGTCPQGRERIVRGPDGVECVTEGASMLMASASQAFAARYLMRYSHPLIGLQFAEFSEGEDAVERVAPARTFGLFQEARELQAKGLARGASEENAIIVYDDAIRPPLRFKDELVRHKVLDMLGDIALCGCALRTALFGVATGHRANVEMARRIVEGKAV
jgi:UDP-3-O-[3-hydroxymyristoyl] N-acetylglucosamine deacetylase